jgi:hypothetical protein
MHGLTEIIRLNEKAQAKVNGLVATANLSAKIKRNRDRRVEKGLNRK